jgi:siroheme synthase
VTGHGSDGQVPAHDWRASAASGGTIAAYMASKTFRRVAASLIEAGLPGPTPAVAVAVGNASRPNETHLHGTLSTLPDLLETERPSGPTLVLIGAVVALSRAMRQETPLAAQPGQPVGLGWFPAILDGRIRTCVWSRHC